MNFYIFNFKENPSKKCFFLFIASLLICYLTVNFLIYMYETKKTTRTIFINSLTSKYQHIQLNYPKGTLNTVFIGSSRSYLHIDTAFLSAKGIPSYNLSMYACFPLNFPSMIKNALTVSPSNIALGVDLDFFYNDFENRIPTPEIEDIKAQFANELSNKIIIRTIEDYINKIAPLVRYSTTLATKAKIIFNKMTSLYFTQEKEEANESKANNDFPFAPDDRIFSVQKLKKNLYCVKYKNGDSALWGTPLDGNATAFANKNKITKLRIKNIEFMNYLIALARNGGSNVFVYLCAKTSSPINYDLNELQSKLNAPLIDTVHIIPEKSEYWADPNHLNSKGRKLYTEILFQKMCKLDFYKTLTKQ